MEEYRMRYELSSAKHRPINNWTYFKVEINNLLCWCDAVEDPFVYEKKGTGELYRHSTLETFGIYSNTNNVGEYPRTQNIARLASKQQLFQDIEVNKVFEGAPIVTWSAPRSEVFIENVLDLEPFYPPWQTFLYGIDKTTEIRYSTKSDKERDKYQKIEQRIRQETKEEEERKLTGTEKILLDYTIEGQFIANIVLAHEEHISYNQKFLQQEENKQVYMYARSFKYKLADFSVDPAPTDLTYTKVHVYTIAVNVDFYEKNFIPGTEQTDPISKQPIPNTGERQEFNIGVIKNWDNLVLRYNKQVLKIQNFREQGKVHPTSVFRYKQQPVDESPVDEEARLAEDILPRLWQLLHN